MTEVLILTRALDLPSACKESRDVKVYTTGVRYICLSQSSEEEAELKERSLFKGSPLLSICFPIRTKHENDATSLSSLVRSSYKFGTIECGMNQDEGVEQRHSLEAGLDCGGTRLPDQADKKQSCHHYKQGSTERGRNVDRESGDTKSTRKKETSKSPNPKNRADTLNLTTGLHQSGVRCRHSHVGLCLIQL